VRDQLHLSVLRLYRRLPTWARRRAVRTIAPSFTVGAMCFIERDDGRLLLVRHAYRARWGVPGGLLNRGEEAADGARREVFEEVGLAVELLGEPRVVVDPEPQRVDLVFRARPAPGAEPDRAAPGSPEILEARWFARDGLPELQHETATALVALARSLGDEVGSSKLWDPGTAADRA
jgi:ADP-ribose pyrophosphatase YjhB (NUDIX family)